MSEIGVQMNGGPISLWMECAERDPLRVTLHALRDPVVRALLVGREYERAEWAPPGVLNLITRRLSGDITDRLR
jgi:hypothetical protein